MYIESWGTALRYMSCAASIVFAATTEAIFVAAIGCGGLFAEAMDD